jgi:dTDP-L-rhamnose 4-epimerase
LVAGGHRVRVLDTLSPQVHGDVPEDSALYQSILGKVEFHRGSVTSRADLLAVLPGCDTVVHLAAETGTGQSMYAIRHYTDVNIGGTALLLDLIANERLPVRRLVVASSRAVCGEGKYRCDTHGIVFPAPRIEADMATGDFGVHCPVCRVPAQFVPTDEETPVRPSSVYGITKLTQEQMVLTVGQALGISAVAFRYQNVYGPGQSLSNPYTGILSIFSTRIRSGNGIRIFEDGHESRDFVYIDDVVAVTQRAVEFDGPLSGVFNVGSGVATDVLTIAQTLQALLGGRSKIEVTGQFRLGDIRHNVADLTKVSKILRFASTVSIAHGLQHFVAWVDGEQMQTDRYEESLSELKVKGLFR